MLTPQDIKDKKFEKALVGGYEMAVVDDFLEQITEDYTVLYKETAILKSKLKVLVEKVEEYRSTEDSMRLALLTAQKMGNEIVEEAREKSAAILAEVHEQAQSRSIELREKIATEETRLAFAKKQTDAFSKRVLGLINQERTFIKELSALAIPTPKIEPDPSLAAPVQPIVTPVQPAVQATPVAATIAPAPVTPTPVVQTISQPTAAPSISLDEMESSAGAYLAEEVSRMVNAPGEAKAPQPSNEPEEVEFFKLFNFEATEQPAEKTDPFAALGKPLAEPPKADETIDIARSISESLGGTEEIKANENAFYDDEGSPTTKRPRFDFSDLQFGSNYDDTSEE